MAAIVPVQDAITGSEPQSNLAEPLQALAQFYRALNARDMSLMEQNWDNTDQAAMDNPLGGIKRGWAEIKPVYERLFGWMVAIALSSTTTRCTGSAMSSTWWAESADTYRSPTQS
jgi:hypothetical protein